VLLGLDGLIIAPGWGLADFPAPEIKRGVRPTNLEDEAPLVLGST
jgi:hypothetical protein